MVWLPNGEKSLRICLAVQTEYRRVTDGRMDGQTSLHSIVRAMHTRRAVMSALTNLVTASKHIQCLYVCSLMSCKTSWSLDSVESRSRYCHRIWPRLHPWYVCKPTFSKTADTRMNLSVKKDSVLFSASFIATH